MHLMYHRTAHVLISERGYDEHYTVCRIATSIPRGSPVNERSLRMCTLRTLVSMASC
jgi:hypothetical protein